MQVFTNKITATSPKWTKWKLEHATCGNLKMQLVGYKANEFSFEKLYLLLLTEAILYIYIKVQ